MFLNRLFLIRVKFGPCNSTFLVFQVYQIILLFRRRVDIRYIYIFYHFFSLKLIYWQYMTPEVTLYLELNQNQSKM